MVAHFGEGVALQLHGSAQTPYAAAWYMRDPSLCLCCVCFSVGRLRRPWFAIQVVECCMAQLECCGN